MALPTMSWDGAMLPVCFCLFICYMRICCALIALHASVICLLSNGLPSDYHLDGVSAQRLCVFAARRAAKQPQSLHIPFLKNSHRLQEDILSLYAGSGVFMSSSMFSR